MTRCRLWRSPGQIGRLGSDGTISEYPLPDRDAKPHAITTAPSGYCWFTEWGANRLASITASGAVTEYHLPTPSSEPHGIAAGPDGALWTALEIGSVARYHP
jgi:virginiamycin B lyase